MVWTSGNGMDHGNPAAGGGDSSPIPSGGLRHGRAGTGGALWGTFSASARQKPSAKRWKKTFYNAYGLQLEVRRDMGPDYSAGMKALALRQLKRTLFGTAWEEE